jgi:hypothetical protein
MKLTKLSKIELLSALSIAVGIISSGAGISTTVASADSTSAAAPTSSSIARSVLHADQLQAMGGALNMSTAQVQTHLKAHDLKQVVAASGLSADTYHQKVQAQMKSELQAQGYSQTQIDSALQRYQQRSTRN